MFFSISSTQQAISLFDEQVEILTSPDSPNNPYTSYHPNYLNNHQDEVTPWGVMLKCGGSFGSSWKKRYVGFALAIADDIYCHYFFVIILL